MARVYVSCRLPEPIPEELARSFAVTAHPGAAPPSRAELLAGCAGHDGLLVTPLERVDAELLDAAGPQLRVVANHAVGYDNVDVAAATARGVVVANTPGVLTRATAELTLALLLALLRRIAEGDRFLRRSAPWIWSPVFMLGTGLDGKTLGIVGLGRIGREVARLGEAFGMRVVYASPRPQEAPWPRLELADLLATADVVSLHCPLGPATRHLIDAPALATMRPTAVLVNTTRGPVVDEAALADALSAGTIAGAALDVYEREPEVHPGLLGLDQVVLSPHLGSATVETRVAMGRLCVAALETALLEGRCPDNALDPAAWRPAP
ncbi:MAG: D-glycerate dehydrogenase [Thermoleophilia bacterium]|nr:D-glycerate dehydrogenase [Thermoleophilia bacterium]